MSDSNDKGVEGIETSILPAEAHLVLEALRQFQSHQEIDQTCLICGATLDVVGVIQKGELDHSVWKVSCHCGKCNETFRGL